MNKLELYLIAMVLACSGHHTLPILIIGLCLLLSGCATPRNEERIWEMMAVDRWMLEGPKIDPDSWLYTKACYTADEKDFAGRCIIVYWKKEDFPWLLR